MSGLAPTQSLSDILVSQSPSDSPSSSPEQLARDMDVQAETAAVKEAEGGGEEEDKDKVEEGDRDRDGNGDEERMEVQRDEQEVESDDLAMESESDAGPSQSSPQGRRVKVYELRDASWFDRGTGYCRGVFDETNDLALLVVEPEDAAAAGEEGREPEGEGGFLKDDLLLNARVEKEDIYTRQQDTLIVWTEPGSQLDIAMSFQDAEGCHDIWSFIIEVQRHLNSLPGDSAAPSSSSPLSASPMLGVTTQAAINHDRPWQLPTLANIREQEMMLRMQSKSAPGRDRAVEHIMSEEYIKHLVGVFEQAEDLESLDDLHALCSVMQTIILFNDNGILEYILQDDVFFGVIGILEYDPEYPSLKASYRQFYSDISKFRQVVEIKDAGIQFKIHQTYRLQYLKEVVLARLLDDPTFGILNGFIFFNQVDIVGHIQSDESLLIELFSRFRNGNGQPDGSDAGASLDEKKRDTVMFLHQLMLMGKQIQVPTRLALYRNLLDRGLLSVCEWAFRRHEAQILHAAAEMLTLVVDHDVNAVRGHVLKEEAEKKPTLIVEMVQLMTATKNLGLLSQMSDILKTLLETAPEGESFVQKREGPTAESFVTFFYDSCAARLFAPLLELPEITNSNPPLKLSREQATLVQHLVELLSFCVLSHSHRASYFVLSNPVSKKITSLLYLREKTLRHTALRFVKSCLKTPNHFMHRHYTKNDLMLPLVVLLEEEGGKDNMLSSSCLDVLEAIRKDNIKTIINYLYENYRPRIEVLSQRPFLRPFLGLMTQRWEQLNEPPPPPPVIEAESSKAWSRAAEAQEEEYFNASDDEEIGPKPPAEVRPPIKRKRSTPVTPGGPPSKRAAKAAAAAAAATTTATVATVTVSSAPSLGLDYDDGSDSEGSSGGQSPRLAPKAEGGTGPPPITPPEELAEDLGDMAMKMRAKRQREEEEDEGFAGLLVKANALGGATGKPASAASATAAGAETTAEPTGEGGGASTPKKKERSTPLKDAGKRIRLSLGSMGIGKALGGGSGNGK